MTNEPTPVIDQRFSDPAATATSWAETREVLETADLSWITTVRRDGRPHVTPLVAVWLDSSLHFCTGAAEQKAINLATNPQVIVTTGCNRWETGLDVVVEGEAVRVDDQSTLERLAAAWALKWDGQWQFDVEDGVLRSDGGGDALVFAVAPTKVLAFGKGPFSHTRYLFPTGS